MGQKMMQTEKEACQLNQGAVHIDSYWKGIQYCNLNVALVAN